MLGFAVLEPGWEPPLGHVTLVSMLPTGSFIQNGSPATPEWVAM